MEKVIGSTTIYRGTEHRHIYGYRVRILAVLKSKAQPELGLVSDDYDYIDDEVELQLAGGVKAIDRLEVSPWLPESGRFSFAVSDARAVDVDLFLHLRPRKFSANNRSNAWVRAQTKG
jgi:hypothetical protein